TRGLTIGGGPAPAVSLPRAYPARTSLVHDGGVSEPSEPSAGAAGSVAKGLVLVVEDERPIADLLRLYLTRDGFGVHVEYDGTAGLAAARRLRPVACVLDIALPG